MMSQASIKLKRGEIKPKETLRPQTEREETNSRNVESSPLNDLLSALYELKDLFKRRPMVANVITLKNCPGSTGNAEMYSRQFISFQPQERVRQVN
ncbi:hypothetical protein JTB14_032214 [Gonioctena quinquepunctata]|nr:hypothetical protein JTB14_032214 [Gonioctena quinquepunctata]